MKQMSRSDARIKAYELIFMINSCEDYSAELEKLSVELKEHKKHVRYITEVVTKTFENVASIDSVISQNLDANWTISRLSKMCLATLRLAIAEIMYLDEIPNSVSINEAVEIAKIFGDENEAPFVNALLGKIVK